MQFFLILSSVFISHVYFLFHGFNSSLHPQTKERSGLFACNAALHHWEAVVHCIELLTFLKHI